MEVSEHLLINGVSSFIQSPNHSGSFSPGDLDTIIIHYTAGASASSSIRTLTDPLSKASAHIVIARDGAITQLVRFDTIAWHAGKSQFDGREGFNKYSIGIEIDNAGLLEKRGHKYYSWFNREYGEDQVVPAIHRNQSSLNYWHSYTEAQIDAVTALCELLITKYGIKYILGHEEISPRRKLDPGPAFPLDKLRDRLLGSARDEDGPEPFYEREMMVNVNALNIRSAPNTAAIKVALPLSNGHKVKALERNGDWVKVNTEITGWVAEKYLK